MVVIAFGSMIYIVCYSISDPDWNGDGGYFFTGIMYLVLGILFAITSFNIIKQLKLNFDQFYRENKVNLIIASIGLTFPLLVRGAVDTYSVYWS